MCRGYDLPSIRRPRWPFSLFPSLLCYAQVCEENNALLVVITKTYQGTGGGCDHCMKAEGEHFKHYNGNKYCYVSTTSPCPPPHVYGLAVLSYAKLTPYLLLSHRRSSGAVMALVLFAKKPKEPISTTPTATIIAS
jgi:hypothetical protein